MSEKLKIDLPIISQKVLKDEPAPAPAPAAEPSGLTEKTPRPEKLPSVTYKIKPPISDHAVYLTISDIEVNGERRPFEVFANCKDMDHFQWITALMLTVSGLFRKGGDATFIIDELKSVTDPNGGYILKGGKFMPSLVAHIGHKIEDHMKGLGMIDAPEMSETTKAILAEKKAELAASEKADESENAGGDYPANATVCPKCSTKAVVTMDGCGVCLECGDSKCL